MDLGTVLRHGADMDLETVMSPGAGMNRNGAASKVGERRPLPADISFENKCCTSFLFVTPARGTMAAAAANPWAPWNLWISVVPRGSSMRRSRLGCKQIIFTVLNSCHRKTMHIA